MSGQILRKLDFTRKLLLSVAASAAIAVPIILGLISVSATPSRAQSSAEDTTTPTIQSVSLKPSTVPAKTMFFKMMYSPGEFVANNVTMQTIIQEAYGVQAGQIAPGPDWLDSRYDFDVKVEKSQAGEFGLGPNLPASHRVLQAALASAIKLVVHTETRELPTYSLIVAESGAKLQPSQPMVVGAMVAGAMPGSNGEPAHDKTRFQMLMKDDGQNSGMTFQALTMDGLAEQLSRELGVVVVDKTGLKGNYDFNLQWSKGAGQQSEGADSGAASDAPSGPSLFTAIQEQLGLKLQAQQAPTQILVIDHIDKPAEN